MAKARTSIMVFGSILLCVISCMCTYFGLLGTGVIPSTVSDITITIQDIEKEYDGTPLMAEEYELSGQLLDGHHVEIEYTGEITNVGTKNSNANVKVLDSSNYNVSNEYKIQVVPGTLEVTPRPITVASLDASKCFDGTPITSSDVKVSSGELIKGHVLAPKFTTQATTVEESGTAILFTCDVFDIHGNDVTKNYALQYSNGSYKITNSAITLRTETNTHVYDGSPFSGNSYSIVGGALAEGHSISQVIYNMESSITDVGSVDSIIDDIVIVDEGGNKVNGDYTISYQNVGKLVVTPYTLNLDQKSATKEYDGTPLSDASFEITNENLKLVDNNFYMAGNKFSCSIDVDALPTITDVSTINNTLPLVIKDAYGKDVTENFNIVRNTATLSITEKYIVVYGADETKEYDGQELTATKDKYNEIKTKKVLVSDDQYFEVVYGTTSITKAGTTPSEIIGIHVFEKVGEEVKNVTKNYDITTVAGSLTVTPKTITIKGAKAEHEYDGKYYTYQTQNDETIEGLIAGDSVTLTYTAQLKDFIEGGVENTFTEVIKNKSNEDVTSCYKISRVFDRLEITKKDIKVELSSDISHMYDGKEYVMTEEDFTLDTNDRPIQGENLVITFDYKAKNGSKINVGEYDLTKSDFIIENGFKDNYNLITNIDKVTLKITKSKIKLAPVVDSINHSQYTKADQKLAASAYTLVPDDDYTGTIPEGEAFEMAFAYTPKNDPAATPTSSVKAVGSYVVKMVKDDIAPANAATLLSNYDIECSTKAEFTIDKKVASIAMDETIVNQWMYDNTEKLIPATAYHVEGACDAIDAAAIELKLEILSYPTSEQKIRFAGSYGYTISVKTTALNQTFESYEIEDYINTFHVAKREIELTLVNDSTTYNHDTQKYAGYCITQGTWVEDDDKKLEDHIQFKYYDFDGNEIIDKDDDNKPTYGVKNANTYFVVYSALDKPYESNYSITTKQAIDTITYTVKKYDLSTYTLDVYDDSFVYTGTVQKAEVQELKLEKKLEKDKDYIVEYSNASSTNAGKYWISYTPKDNENLIGELKQPYEIQAKAISSTITPVALLVYNQQEQTQHFTVKDGATTLTEDVDYTVTDNVKTSAGTYTAQIQFIGNYSGDTTMSFVISPKNMSDAAYALVESLIYNTNEQTQHIEVKDGDYTLVEGVDYTLSNNKNTYAGTSYKLSISYMGNYTGTKSNVSYSIARRDITNAEVTLENALFYNHEEQTQNVASVIVDGINVPSLKVEDNKNTNAGTYTLKVTSTNTNFTGEATKEYTIEKAKIQLYLTNSEVEYNGTKQKYDGFIPSGTWYEDAVISTETIAKQIQFTYYTTDGNKLTGTADGVKELGTYYVEFESLNPNYEVTVDKYLDTIEFKVVEKKTGFTIVLDNPAVAFAPTYDGNEHTQHVKITYKNDKNETITLVENTDYVLSNHVKTDAGTYTLLITYIGNYSGTDTKEFQIKPKAAGSFTVAKENSLVYNGEEQAQLVTIMDTALGYTLVEGKDYTLSNNKKTIANSYSLSVEYIGNYTGTKSNVVYSIAKKNITDADIQLGAELTYTGSVQTQSVSKVYVDSMDISNQYTVSGNQNTNAGTYILTVTASSGNANFTGSATKEYTIAPRKLEVALDNKTVVYNMDPQKYGDSIGTPSNWIAADGAFKSFITFKYYDVNGKLINTGAGVTNVGTYFVEFNTFTNTNYVVDTTQFLSEVTYTIEAYDLKNLSVTPEYVTTVYNKTQQTPSLTIAKYNNHTLVENTDYIVEYSKDERIQVGSYTITLLPKNNNFTGSKEIKYSITPKNASAFDINIVGGPYIYNREDQTIAISIQDTALSYNLVEDVDYRVTGNVAQDVKDTPYTMEIEFIGNYTGSKTKNYSIVQKSGSGFTVNVDTLIYDGTDKTIVAHVMDGDFELTSGTDYTLDYEKQKNANTYTDAVTVIFLGNYSSTKTISYTIEQKDLSNLDVEVIGSYLYNGATQTVTLSTIKDGATELTKGTDYTVAGDAHKNAGDYVVTISYEGNYKGTSFVNYTIEQRVLHLFLSNQTVTYNKSLQKFTGYMAIEGEWVSTDGSLEDAIAFTYYNPDLTIANVDNSGVKDAKKYYVEFQSLTDNYSVIVNHGLPEITFTVEKLDLAEITADLGSDSEIYDKSITEYVMSIANLKHGTTALAITEDYVLAYSNPHSKNAGEYTITVTPGTNTNITGSKVFTYKIEPKDMSSIDVTKTNTLTYNHLEQTQAIEVKDGTYSLILGTDYTISGNKATAAGNYELEITYIGNYTGTKTVSYTVEQKLGTTCVVTPATLTYNTQPQELTVTIVDGAYTLVEGEDYTLVYTKETSADSYAYEIHYKGNYKGTDTTKNYTIHPLNLADVEIELVNSLVYSGATQTQNIKVTIQGYELTNNVDYVITNNAKKNAGTYTLTISAKASGSCTGTKSMDFTIAKTDLRLYLANETMVYNGQAQKYTAYSYDASDWKDSPALVKDSILFSYYLMDGTTPASINDGITHVGQYYAKFKSLTDNYNVITDNVLPTITMEALDLSNVTYDPITTEFTFDTTSSSPATRKPSITNAKIGTLALVVNTDYIVKYSNENSKNAGTYTVSILPKSTDFVGSKEITYTISSVNASGFTVTEGTALTYTGSSQTKAITIKNASGVTLVEGRDYTRTGHVNTDAGNYAMTITYIGNYYGTKEFAYTIKQKDISSSMSLKAHDPFTYDGQEHAVEVQVKDGAKTLTREVHYVVSGIESAVDAGTYHVIVTALGNYTGTMDLSYTISPKDGTGLTVTPEVLTYNRSLQHAHVSIIDGTYTLVAGKDYTLTNDTNTNAGTYSLSVTYKGNYTGAKSNVSYTILPKDLSDVKISLAGTYTYNGLSQTITLPSLYDDIVELTKGTDYTVAGDSNKNAGDYEATITYTGNYTGTYKLPYSIAKRDLHLTLNAQQLEYNTQKQKYTAYSAGASEWLSSDGTLSEKIKFIYYNTNGSTANIDNTGVISAGVYNVGFNAFTNADLNNNYNVIPSAAISEVIFEITAIDLADCTFTQDYSVFAYNQATQKSTISNVAKDTIALAAGTDYEASYENENSTNAGTYKITLIPLNSNYKGKKEITYSINPKAADSFAISLDGTYTYNQKEQTVSVKIMDGTYPLVEGVDYTLANNKQTNVGATDYTLTVTYKGNYTSTNPVEKKYNIAPLSLSDATVTLGTTLTYTAVKQTQAVAKVMVDDLVVPTANYTVSNNEQTNAGTYTLTVTANDSNYKDSVNASFTIKKAPLHLFFANQSEPYTGTLQTYQAYSYDTAEWYEDDLASPISLDDVIGFNYYSLDGIKVAENLGVKDAGTYYVVFDTVGNSNYEIIVDHVVAEVTFTIGQVNLEDVVTNAITTEFTYSGSAQKPEITTVTSVGGYALAAGDYTLVYSNASSENVGEYTVTILPDSNNNVVGSKVITYTISPLDCSSYTVTPCSNFTYDGTKHTMTVTFKDGVTPVTLALGTDYTLSNHEATEVGASDYTATVTYIGNYKGTNSFTYNVTPKNAASFAVDIAGTYTYTKAAQTVKVNIQDTALGYTLVEGTDYTLSGNVNTDANTYTTLVVTYKGNYSGSRTGVSYTIAKMDLSKATIILLDELTYDGTTQTQSIQVISENGITLVKDTDYSVANNTNINAGTYTLTVAAVDASIENTANKTYTIEKAKASIILYPQVQAYTGSTIEYSNYELDGITNAELDITYRLSDGTDVSSPKNANTYYVNITNANYDIHFTTIGETTLTITKINFKNLDVVVHDDKVSFAYDGTVKLPVIDSIQYNSEDLAPTLYTEVKESSIHAGLYQYVIKPSTTAINYEGEYVIEYEITEISITDSSISITQKYPLTYNGQVQYVEYIVKNGSKVLIENQDYVLVQDGNKNAGTDYTAQIIGIGDYDGTKDLTYDILAKSLNSSDITYAITNAADLIYDYDSTLAPVLVIYDGTTPLASATDYTCTITRNKLDVGVKTTTATGTGNYTGTMDIEYIIMVDLSIADLVIAADFMPDYNYGEKIQVPSEKYSLTVNGGTIPSKYWMIQEGTDVATEAGNYSLVIVPKDTATAKGSISDTYTVSKLELNVTSTDAIITYDGKPHGIEECITTDLQEGFTISYVSNTFVDAGDAKTVTATSYKILDENGKDVTSNFKDFLSALTGNITIRQRAITIYGASVSGVYGDVLPSGTEFTYSGELVAGHKIEVNYSTVDPSVTSLSFSSSIKDENGVNVKSNYKVTPKFGNAAITKREVTITVKDVSIEYGEDTPTYSFVASNTVNGKSITASDFNLSCNYDSSTNNNAGTYTIDAIKLTTTHDKYYSYTIVPGTLTVAKKNITITTPTVSAATDVTLTPEMLGIAGIKIVGVDNSTASEIRSKIVMTNATLFSVAGVYTNGCYVDNEVMVRNYNITYVFGNLQIKQTTSGDSNDITSSHFTYEYQDTITYGETWPSITVKKDGVVLDSMDYVVYTPTMMMVGNNSFTVQGQGSYSGIKTLSIKVEKKNITIVTESVEAPINEPLTPAILRKDNIQILGATDEAEIGTIRSNIHMVNDGQSFATAGVYANSCYVNDTMSKYYTITYVFGNIQIKDTGSAVETKDITSSDFTFEYNSSIYYDEDMPGVIVKEKGSEITSNCNISYPDIKGAGTYVITVTGTGTYSGTKQLLLTVVDVAPIDISLCQVTVNDVIVGQDRPTPVVKYDAVILNEGTDYTVIYQDSTTNSANAGTYFVIVIGQGKYTGYKQVTYKVE